MEGWQAVGQRAHLRPPSGEGRDRCRSPSGGWAHTAVCRGGALVVEEDVVPKLVRHVLPGRLRRLDLVVEDDRAVAMRASRIAAAGHRLKERSERPDDDREGTS